MLEAMPLTRNGKVDRKALPEWEIYGEKGRYVAPRNEVEEIVSGIWSEVLGVREVGVEDNFFELGGHSLLATQVVANIRQILQVDIPLEKLFSYVTVAELSEFLITNQNKPGQIEKAAKIAKEVLVAAD
jgi:acyl carrier protein